jgi:PAS domain S-box-containing protein
VDTDLPQQKHLVLILARAFASNLSTPMMIVDARGRLVFYNEAAEALTGRRFSEAEEMPMDEWIAAFEPRTASSEPLPPESRPARIAFDEHRASHLRYVATAAAGETVEVEVTAFPLFAQTEEFVGIVTIFWRV